ncbi:MAG: hypothetical protein KF696_12195 [Planctomycetes bacterium]|nr:hypothetical protein [Planctomycetota bacterium]MCW8136561.1 hypothetical protein [Planctomycetota bacterium]
MPRDVVRDLLVFTVALTCIGTAWSLLTASGPVFTLLWINFGWHEGSALAAERAAAFVMFVCAALLPAVYARQTVACVVAAVVAGCWLALAAVAAALTESWQPWLIMPAQAARFGACFALVLLAVNRWAALALIVLCSSATFAAHGVEALLGRGLFIDFLIGGALRVGWQLPQATAAMMLFAIGVADLACAAALPAIARWRHRPRVALLVPGWMALWGLLTALVRTLEFGAPGGPETLIRVANGALPLTLLLVWMRRAPESQ